MTNIIIDCGNGNGNGNGGSSGNSSAKNDSYTDTENNTLTLNVTSNDSGTGKTLYSVDQSNPNVVQTSSTSDLGATVKIVNGEVFYDPTGSAAIQGLSAGQTAVDTFTYTIRLSNGQLSTATVKVTITGSNDAPVLSADTSGSHTIVEHPAVAGSPSVDTSSATLNFTDHELLDVHSVSVGAAQAVWSGGSTLPSGLQALLNGAVKTSEYDSNILTQTAAAAEAAVDGIFGAISSLFSGSGVSSAVNQAESALSTAASLFHPGSGSIGLTFSATDSAFDFLGAGETLKVTYNVTVADNHGGTSTQPVTFTVTGTNDVPVLSADAVANHALTEIAGATGSAIADTATGALAFTDVDLNDTHAVSIGAAAATWSGGSALPASLQATLNAALKGVVADSTHTGSGSVGLTFSAADKTFDFLAAGETLKVTYNVTVTDSSGATSTQPVTVTITGTNDGPALSPDSAAIHGVSEIAGATAGAGLDSASATLAFADVDLNDSHTVAVGTAAATWSGGSTLPAGLQTALNAAAHATLADSTHTGSGSVGVAFSAADKAFDFLGAGETLKVTYNVTVTDNHGAASTQAVTFTVTGTNDAPVLSADPVANHALTELAGVTASGAADTASTTLTFTDVDLNDAHTASVGAASAVWSGGSALPSTLQTALNNAVTATVADSTHTGSGSVGVAFSAADGAFDFLGAGETLKVTYNVTVSDGQGGTSTQPVTFTVTGTNDAPVLSADRVAIHGMSEIAGVTGGAGAESASTTLNFADADLNDTHAVSVGAASAVWSGGSALPAGLQTVLNSALSTTLADSTHTGSGSVGVAFAAADKAFDFLSAGETLRVTYNVTVTDSQGAASTKTVSFVVTGTNDAPVLAADAVANHAMNEIAGVTAGSGADSAAATLNFADVDLNDTHAVSVGAASASWSGGSTLPAGLQSALNAAATTTLADSTHAGSGSVGVAFAAADSAFDFLAAGETLTVTYNVTVTDAHGATSTQPVTFTVTGTNDAPVLAADASGVHAMTEIAGVTAGSGADSAAATLNFADVDLNDTHAVSVGAASAAWSGGSALPAGLQSVLNGAVTTALTDSAHSGSGSVGVNFAAADNAFDFLAAGETLTVTYNVTVTDAQGATSTQPVTFTVTGTNDAPVLAADASGAHAMTELAGVTGSAAADGASATLAFTDADLNDTHTVSVGAASAAWSGGAGLPAGLQAVLDNAAHAGIADSTHTGAGSVGVNFAAADNAFDFLAAGETLTVTYNVTVTDAQGAASTQAVTFTVTGTNDAPVLAADTGPHAITEQAGVTGSAAHDTASTTLTFTDADLNDAHGVGVSNAMAVWSGGPGLPAGVASALNSAITVGGVDSTHTGAGTVALTFSAADGAFDFLAAGETLTVTYNIIVRDVLGATSSVRPVTFTVTGTNDAPVLAADTSAHGLTEIAGATHGAGIDFAVAALTFTDVDLDDTHAVSVAHTGTVWSGGSALPSGLQAMLDHAAQASVSDSIHAGTGAVGVAFAAADNAFDFLAAGETLQVTYNVTVTDNNGATSTQPVTFTVTGTNDAPVLGADISAHGLTEIAGTTHGAGIDFAVAALTFTDVDLDDTHAVSVGPASATWSGGSLPDGLQSALNSAAQASVSDSTHAGTGAVGVAFAAADNTFDFLGAGETLRVTYNVTVSDGYGGASTQPVTFTVTGTNDAPVLAADASGAHTLTEFAGETGSGFSNFAIASLNFADVDLNDTHAVTVSNAAANWSGGSALPDGLQAVLDHATQTSIADSTGTGAGSIGMIFSAADNAFDFLAAGETLTVSYNVTVTDNNGATSTQPVTFTVTGTNDAPVLGAQNGGPQWTAGEIADVTGYTGIDGAAAALVFTDVDLTDSHTVSLGNAAAVWSGGSVLPDGLQAVLDTAAQAAVNDSTGAGAGSVNVTFLAADNSFDFLAAGETLTVTYNVTVSDGHGGTSSQPISFLMTGTNDAPVLTAQGEPLQTAGEQAGVTGYTGNDGISATLGFTDVDLNDSHIVAVSNASVAWSGGSALPDGLQAMLDTATQAVVNDGAGTGSGMVSVIFNAADNAFDFLSAGETLTVTYDITVSDGNGGTSTQPMTFLVTGTNDAPILAVDTSSDHAMTELAGATGSAATDGASATLAFTDVDLNDTHAVSVSGASANWSGGAGLPAGLQAVLDNAAHATVADSTGAGSGSVGVNFAAADHTFDFLAAGETLTVSYDVTVTDAQGAASTQTVTFTVTGTNDAPVLAADAGGPHAIAEQAGLTGSAAIDTATATLTFTDADLDDAHAVGVSSAIATWSGGAGLPAGLQSVLNNAITFGGHDSTHTGSGTAALTFSAADGAFDFLAAGQTLAVTYNVIVRDSQGAVSSTHPVTFTVTGTNDVPVLSADTGAHIVSEVAGVTAGAAVDTASTVLGFTDADLTDTHTSSYALASSTWSGGTIPTATATALAAALSLGVTDGGAGAGQLSATFGLADKLADFLGAGETLTATYNVTVNDGHGGTATRPVTFTVTGTNDAPVLGAAPVSSPQTAETFTFESTEAPSQSSNGSYVTTVDRDFTFAGQELYASSPGGLGNPASMDYIYTHATLPNSEVAEWHRTDGKEFSLQGFDVSAYDGGSAQVTFKGYDHGVLVATKTVTLTSPLSSPYTAYQTLTLDSTWSKLDDVQVFTASATNGYVFLDNIKVGAPTAGGGGAINLAEIASVTGSTAALAGSTTLTFTDVDQTDHHTASVGAPTAVWSGGTLPSGLIAALSGALSTSVADSTGTGAGSLTAAFAAQDHTFDFLATGETLTVTYNVTIDDGHGGTSSQPVTITVTGTNDAPVIAADAGAHTVSELAGVTGSASTDTASATLAFTDVDLNDTHAVSVSAASATWSGGSTLPGGLQAVLNSAVSTTLGDSTHTGSGTIGVNFAAGDSAFDFLAAGQVLTATYNVTVNDGHGGTSTQPVTFTVTGTNDVPVLAADTGAHIVSEVAGVTAGAAVDTASTVLGFTDADLTDTHTSSYALASSTWSGGTIPTATAAALAAALSLGVTDGGAGAGQLSATFGLADKLADFLGAGETLTATYNVTINDGHGGTSTRPVTFTVTGANDAPVLAATPSSPQAAETFTFESSEAPIATSVGGQAAIVDRDFTFVGHQLYSVLSGGLGNPGSMAYFPGHATLANGEMAEWHRTDGKEFSLQAFDVSGYVSTGEQLTIKAYDHGTLVGTQLVTLADSNGNLAYQTVTLGSAWTNIDDVQVFTTAGSYADIFFDNIKIGPVGGGSASLVEISATTNSTTTDAGSATLTFTDVDLTDHHTASVGAPTAVWSGGTLPSGLIAALSGALSTSVADSTGTGAGSLTAAFAAQDHTFDFLATGETLTVTYNVTIDDGHGGTSSQPVTITVTGTNDAPVIAADAGAHTVSELAGVTGSASTDTASATLAFTDVDLNDAHSVSVSPVSTIWSGGSALPSGLQAVLNGAVSTTLGDSTHTGSGSVGVNFAAADHTFDFLAAGETLTVSYDVTVTDAQGAASTQTVTFTVTGTNDAPVLAADAGGPHAIAEQAGLTGSAAIDTATATLTFTDADLDDAHAVGVSSAIATWSGGPGLPAGLQSVLNNAITFGGNDSTHTGSGAAVLTFSAADGAFDFLAAGQTLTVTYNVMVRDSQGAVSSTHPVTFTVTGTNDAPVLAADTGSHAITEQAGQLGSASNDGTSATLTFSDVDLTDSHSTSISAATAVWSGGTLPSGVQAVLNGAVHASLGDSSGSGSGTVTLAFLAADKTFDFLAAGETLQATYNVTVSDGHGGTSTKPVTFTVTGTNDAPALAAGPNLSGAVSFYGAEGNSADTVGHNNGMDHGTTYVAGHDGQAFNFTGSNYTTIGNIIPSDFTMSGWLKTTANSPTGAQFFNGNGLVYADVGGLSHDFGVSILNNHLAFGTGGNFDSTIQSTTLVNTGNWINWAVTRSGSIISIFINGVLEATEDTTYSGLLNAPTQITLGANTVDGRYFVGQLDDLAIYNRALSPLEIQQHSVLGSASLVEASGPTSASVSLTLTDADLTDTHTVTLANPVLSWSGGVVPAGLAAQLSASGAVTADTVNTGVGSITVTMNAADHAFDFLAQGETLTITYNATVNDGHGGTATQPAVFTVTGINNAPTIHAPANVLVADTAGAVALGLTATDPDTNDILSVSIDSLTGGVGTLKLADGTVVAVGQALTAAQFAGLSLTAAAGGLNGAIHYTVTDGHGGSFGASEAISTFTSAPAASEVLNFDNLVGETFPVPSGYGASGTFQGLVFHNIGATPVYAHPDSSPNSLFPVGGVQSTSITTVSGDVHLIGFDIARESSVSSVIVTFKESGTVVGTQTVNLPGADGGNSWVHVQGPSSNITEIDFLSNTSGWWKADNISLSLGNAVNATETGGTGSNLLAGGTGNDVLTGTAGADTFAFNTANFGQDTINAFTAGADILQFSHTLFADSATALGHAAQVGSNVVITFDANDTVTLSGMSLSSLHSSDFHIV